MFKAILQKIFVFLSFVLMMLGVYFAYLEYSLFRIEVERNKDPLIQYAFEDKKRAFVVSGGNNVEIKEVVWSMPSLATTAPARINEHPHILTLEALKKQLYDDSTYLLTGLSPHDREHFIRCGILGNTHSLGIPLIAEITFRQRGITELGSMLALVYAEWLESEYPFIEVYDENATEEERMNFIKRSLIELQGRFKGATDVTSLAKDGQNNAGQDQGGAGQEECAKT